MFDTVQPQFRNACQKGVSSLFAEESTWSTAVRSNSPAPSLLSGKSLCFKKMLLTIIKHKIFIFLFLLWNVSCPQETSEGVSCDLSVAVSWWPSYHSRQNPATQLVFEITADVRPPSLAGINRQLLQFCFYYIIAIRLFQADSYNGMELLSGLSVINTLTFMFFFP